MKKEMLKYPIPAADGFICPFCGEIKKFGDESKNCPKCGNEMMLCSKEHNIALGNTMYYTYSDFDGAGVVEGTVADIHEEHFMLQDTKYSDMQYYFTYDQLEVYVFRTREEAKESIGMC